MGGLKFLITLFVIYLIFRSIMRKVLSAVNSEGGGALKGKLGDVIEQMKREMEKAKLEAEREAAGMDEDMAMSDDPWAELREASDAPLDESDSWEEELLEEEATSSVRTHERWDAADERPSLHERWNAGDESPSLHERWDAEDEAPSLWDSTDDERAPKVATALEVAPERCRPQGKRHRRRMRLKEAVIWKEVLDRPIGLRS